MKEHFFNKRSRIFMILQSGSSYQHTKYTHYRYGQQDYVMHALFPVHYFDYPLVSDDEPKFHPSL